MGNSIEDITEIKGFSNSESEENDTERVAGSEEGEEKGRKPWENVVAATGIVLGQGQGISEINAQKLAEQRNSQENNPPITEQYQEDIAEDSSGFVFLNNSEGSGLDSEGFPKENSVAETAEINDVIDISDLILSGDLESRLEIGYERNHITIEVVKVLGPGRITIPSGIWDFAHCGNETEDFANINNISFKVTKPFKTKDIACAYGFNDKDFLEIPIELYNNMGDKKVCTFVSFLP